MYSNNVVCRREFAVVVIRCQLPCRQRLRCPPLAFHAASHHAQCANVTQARFVFPAVGAQLSHCHSLTVTFCLRSLYSYRSTINCKKKENNKSIVCPHRYRSGNGFRLRPHPCSTATQRGPKSSSRHSKHRATGRHTSLTTLALTPAKSIRRNAGDSTSFIHTARRYAHPRLATTTQCRFTRRTRGLAPLTQSTTQTDKTTKRSCSCDTYTV